MRNKGKHSQNGMTAGSLTGRLAGAALVLVHSAQSATVLFTPVVLSFFLSFFLKTSAAVRPFFFSFSSIDNNEMENGGE